MVRARSPFVALALTALLVAPAGVAAAHDELIGSDPEDGSTVEAPDELVLTFSGAIGELGAQVAVTGPDGEPVVDGEPEIDGATLEQDLVDELPGGDYEVVWRVTSQDGHPISGELGFTVEEAVPAEGTAATTDEPAATTDEPAVTGEAPEATDDAPPAEASPAEATDGATADTADSADSDVTTDPAGVQGDGGLPVWAWLLVALGVAGVLGLLARTWSRGRT